MKSGMEETMESKPIAHSITTVLIVLAIAASMVSVAKAANTEQVLYSFAGDTDGEYIDSDITMDSAGNIYGTSVQGGVFGTGTVFELSPSNGTWTHTVLYSFTGLADGGQPYKGVTLDAKGNLYGTAVVGGSFAGPCVEAGCGVVYKLTNNGGTWTQRTWCWSDLRQARQSLWHDTAGRRERVRNHLPDESRRQRELEGKNHS
jgi:uncharacterized repeat protein (TIGR03803 family)